MTNNSDLKFFTNTDSDSLYSRFLSLIKDAEYFDILVGYFRTSGFYRLHNELEKVDNIRILVGINADNSTKLLLKSANEQHSLDFETHQNTRKNYKSNLIGEIETEEETQEIATAAHKFIEFIISGKLQLRAYPTPLHAKVYINRFKEGDRDFGSVITGSSNFSENGLIAQREFNVELKDPADVKFALERFEELWADAVDISDTYIDTIQQETWLTDKITPYQLYLKLLYEYFKEDINIDEDAQLVNLPNKFINLEYQKQAVLSAKKILEEYHGVFLADVVGLGKTYITAMLLKQLTNLKRPLIICPPVLKDYWEETLKRFDITHDIESLGKLDDILMNNPDKYGVVVIDEAHRFRNAMTSRYEILHKICRNKKVILVSATPLNNKLVDIKNLIGLFQPLRNSMIPNIRDLDMFFTHLQKDIDKFEKDTSEYAQAVKQSSENVRTQILKYLMVRRTRTEIKKYFPKDMAQQKLFFPEVTAPQKIIYQFDDNIDKIFNETIGIIANLSYARYTPALFLKSEISHSEQLAQRNISGFMKTLLVKRLESSFYAFRKTIEHFITSHQNFINMYDTGTVWISKKVNVYDMLSNNDDDKLFELLETGDAQKYSSDTFHTEYRDILQEDLQYLQHVKQQWQGISTDPKKHCFIDALKNEPILKKQKIIIFSESKDTVDDLQEILNQQFPNKVISFSSQSGTYAGERHNNKTIRRLIEKNYQPDHHEPEDKINLLITTDVLAEGVNLHRANIVINYDLPWNPTKVLQRVGRVNRVGTRHQKIHVFNIFPTAQSDAQIGLEANIKTKLQTFHNLLGEDAKYLSDDEQIGTHKLFGSNIYDLLNSDKIFNADENEENTELYYMQQIRNIRDTDPKLYTQIKNLPAKSRAARLAPTAQSHLKHGLVTFFRKGYVKKFVASDNGIAKELDFVTTAQLLECSPDTAKQEIPKDYFEHLQHNKTHINQLLHQNDEPSLMEAGGGRSNEKAIIKTIKAFHRKAHEYTDIDNDYLTKVLSAIGNGVIANQVLKRIKQELKHNITPLSLLRILRDNITEQDTEHWQPTHNRDNPREVILSEYLIGDGT